MDFKEFNVHENDSKEWIACQGDNSFPCGRGLTPESALMDLMQQISTVRIVKHYRWTAALQRKLKFEEV